MVRKASREVQKEISADTKKMVNGWEDTGEITTSRAEYHPATKEKAVKQALAIEYGKHHVGRVGSK